VVTFYQELSRLLSGLSVIVLEHMGVGLQEEPHICVPDALAHNLGTDASLQSSGRVRVPKIVEGDSFEAGGGRQAVEPLADGIGVRGSAVLEREDVVPGVIVRPEECPLFILKIPPLLKCRSSSSVDRDGLICVARLAARLIPRMPANDNSIVVDRDLASI
jgi:hypothetical protein